jgi:hypothetical protein
MSTEFHALATGSCDPFKNARYPHLACPAPRVIPMNRKTSATAAAPKIDRLPPHSIEAEQGVLGCILLSPGDCLGECKEKLKPGHLAFYDLRHQTLYLTLTEMFSEQRPVDLITLSGRLKDKQQMEGVGGLAYLSTLPDAVPSAANLRYYLDTVLEKYQLRKMVQTCTGIIGRVSDHAGDCKEFVAQAVADLIDCTNGHANAHSLPDIVDAASFIQEKIEAPPELVAGVLHQGSKLVVGGGSKTFKTWTLLDLALAIAKGEPWLSFKTKKGRVLFLNFEIQRPFFRDRIGAVTDGKHIRLEAGMLDLWNLRGHAAAYASLFPRIIERARDGGYSLIVLDPIYKCYGDVDENSAGAVAGLMNAIEGLAVAAGAAVAFGAHYSKGNQSSKESIDRISGSGVFARDPDSILNFTRHEQDDAFTVEMTLRNFKPVAPFVVRWLYPLMRRDDQLDPAKLKQAKGRPKKHTVEKILKCLEGQRLTTVQWQKMAGSEKGVPKTQFYELLGEAEGTPGLSQTTDGQWFYELPKDNKP